VAQTKKKAVTGAEGKPATTTKKAADENIGCFFCLFMKHGIPWLSSLKIVILCDETNRNNGPGGLL
jgi:hypothetical protein